MNYAYIGIIFSVALMSAHCPEFVILIPSYKNEKWVERNLRSVCFQKSTNPYEIICINDCSPDATGRCMDDFVKANDLESKVTIIHNQHRMGAMANIYNAIHTLIPDHKVVVTVDGDDELVSDEVLLFLEKAYQDSSIWMTWGQKKTLSDGVAGGAEALPEHVWTQKSLRLDPFCATHLRTFKAGLFKKIKKSDFLYNNEFFPVAWDLAMMFPMIEMCAPISDGDKPHYLFIPDVLYGYNDLNPIADNRVNEDLIFELGNYIRNKQPYEPIDASDSIVSW